MAHAAEAVGPLHMAEQKQGHLLEPTYTSSVRIRSVALRTYRKRWTIGRGGEKGSGISVLMTRQDDDDDDYPYEFPAYGIKQSDGEAPVMWSIPLLPSNPGPLWPGVVAPDRVLSES